LININEKNKHYLMVARIIDIYYIDMKGQIIVIEYSDKSQEEYRFIKLKDNFKLLKTKCI
ncbi:MAG: hypothetical protein PUC39_03965, partial [Lachnospiraceae bacterium]|nr:hypothetical protein [Lachnospiraceae bacterium]